jgi:hypothetical protein
MIDICGLVSFLINLFLFIIIIIITITVTEPAIMIFKVNVHIILKMSEMNNDRRRTIVE